MVEQEQRHKVVYGVRGRLKEEEREWQVVRVEVEEIPLDRGATRLGRQRIRVEDSTSRGIIIEGEGEVWVGVEVSMLDNGRSP